MQNTLITEYSREVFVWRDAVSALSVDVGGWQLAGTCFKITNRIAVSRLLWKMAVYRATMCRGGLYLL